MTERETELCEALLDYMVDPCYCEDCNYDCECEDFDDVRFRANLVIDIENYYSTSTFENADSNLVIACIRHLKFLVNPFNIDIIDEILTECGFSYQEIKKYWHDAEYQLF